MKNRILILFFLLAYSFCAKAQSNTPPNIVLILVDDSGLMDFGAFGGEAHTPNIDQLAKQGMMFTNFHTSPVCAPSRAMLLTGSDSHLTGVANLPEMMPEGYENEPGYAGVLNDRVLTVATRLKKAGYRTYASGKWHLGYDEKTLPSVRGFDRSFIFGGSGAHNYKAKGYLPMKETAEWFADGKKVDLPEDFYSSKDYIKQAIRFHEEDEDKTAPFFSYIAFQAIHAPLQAPESFVKPYLETYKEGWDVLRQKRFETAKEMGFIPQNASMNGMFPSFKKWDEITKAEQEAYITDMAVLAGMLEAMDYYIGQYVDYLKEKGLYENTIFIVTSDNGPDGADYHSSALARSWQKGQGYHRDIGRYGDPDYYGAIGSEFAHALASPFSFFKYYTGEGGVRTPLIISDPNAFTEIELSYCTSTMTTGLKEYQSPFELSVFPNPAKETVYLNLSDTSFDVNLRIYALSGTLLLEKHLGGNQLEQVDLSTLSAGCYLLDCSNPQIHQSQILIIQK
jgi:arylsulfatase A-like enzyme